MTSARRHALIATGLAALAVALWSGWLPGSATGPLAGSPSAGPGGPGAGVRLLAVRPNDPSVVLIDLGRSSATRYGRTAGMPRDALDGAAITPRGDLLVWADGTARLFTGDPPEADRHLRPRALRRVPGVAPGLGVVPTPDGRGVWLVQPGSDAHGGPRPTLAEFIDLDHGTRDGPFELDAATRAVAATRSGLVVNAERSAEGGQVLRLSREGTLHEVAAGRAVAAGAEVVVRHVCLPGRQRCELHASEADGSGDRHLPAPAGTWWVTVGGPVIPSDAQPLPSVSADGTLLLVAAVSADPSGAGVTTSVLHALDLAGGASVPLLETRGPPPLATLSADGRWVVAVEGSDLLVLEASTAGAAPHRLRAVVPDGHFVLGAG